MFGKRIFLILPIVAMMAFLPLNASFGEDQDMEILKAELKKELKAELAEEIAAEIREELRAEMANEARATQEVTASFREELKTEIMEETQAGYSSQLAKMVKESPLISALKGVDISGFVDTNYFYNLRLHGDEDERQNALSPLNYVGENENNSVTLESFTLFLDKGVTDEHPIGWQMHTYWGEKAKRITFLGEPSGRSSAHTHTTNTGTPIEGESEEGEGWTSGTSDVDRDDIFTVVTGNVSWNAPIGDGITFTFGKMYTWIGLELVENINNPNYSHGILYNNAIPFTHTGLSADLSSFLTFLPDSIGLTLYGVNGWDSFIDNNSSKSWGAYLTWQPNDNFFISLASIYGAEGWDLEAGEAGSQIANTNGGITQMYDVVATYQTPHDPLSLQFNFDWGAAEDGAMTIDGIGTGSTGHWWGVAAYGLYDINDWLQGVIRYEYFDDTDGVRWFAQSIWETTLTANVKIRENLLIRPEYRHNQYSEDDYVGNSGGADSEDIIGVGVEYLF